MWSVSLVALNHFLNVWGTIVASECQGCSLDLREAYLLFFLHINDEINSSTMRQSSAECSMVFCSDQVPHVLHTTQEVEGRWGVRWHFQRDCWRKAFRKFGHHNVVEPWQSSDLMAPQYVDLQQTSTYGSSLSLGVAAIQRQPVHTQYLGPGDVSWKLPGVES